MMKVRYDLGLIEILGCSIDGAFAEMEFDSIEEYRAYATEQAGQIERMLAVLQERLPAVIRSIAATVTEVGPEIQEAADAGTLQDLVSLAKPVIAEQPIRKTEAVGLKPAQAGISLKVAEKSQPVRSEVVKGISLKAVPSFCGNFAGSANDSTSKPASAGGQSYGCFCREDSDYRETGN